MLLLIDERERDLYQALYQILHCRGDVYPIKLEKRVLTLGDAAICEDMTERELVILERKTLKDLIASIKDGRYEEQSYRLTHSTAADFHLHNVNYVIEGPLQSIYNPIERKIVLGALSSIHYFKGFSIMRTNSVEETAEWIVALCHKMERELSKNRVPWFYQGRASNYQPTPSQINLEIHSQTEIANTETNIETNTETNNETENTETNNTEPQEKVKAYCSVVKRAKSANLTPKNIGEVILCQIPSVGSETAQSIMQHFGNSLTQLVHALEQNGTACLDGLTTTDSKGKARKISKTCTANIHRFLLAIE
jgi:ERCC4-type nuclease